MWSLKHLIGYTLIIIGIIVLFFVWYRNSHYSTITRTFSSYTLLSSSWEAYKKTFINSDGRVIDYSQNAVTTSEGQSYALLRAVWIDDRATFDQVWNWTKNNLQKGDNGLFGWRWGKRTDGSYGFLDNGGENPASDADSDIALALILAGRRWQDQQYTEEAKKILQGLWTKEVATADGNYYLIAGPWAKNSNTLILNPSYFAPYAWRLFAQTDKTHDWEALIDPAYALLSNAGKAPLDTNKGVGLPPNWVAIDRKSGDLSAPNLQNLSTDYSFDAMRIPWRVALDYDWNRDERARTYLQSSFSQIANDYHTNNKLPTSYAHNGTIKDASENPAMYSTILGYFMLTDPTSAKKIYQDKITGLYSNDQNAFQKNIPYYEQNWLWFGAALYNNALEKF